MNKTSTTARPVRAIQMIVDAAATRPSKRLTRFSRSTRRATHVFKEPTEAQKNIVASTYWKHRKGKEIRAARDRKYTDDMECDDSVLIMNSTTFLNAYILNITPIVINTRRTYADVAKSGWF